MTPLSEPWQTIGNWELVIFTASYICSFALFILLRPRDMFEWVTTFKIGGVGLVGINGVAVTFFGIGTNQPLRVIVLGLATIFCWWFTICSYKIWLQRRRRGGT
jgi:hypothetical protein